MSGPLQGVTVVELAGLGALPFGTLKLADMGADVIRVDRAVEVPGSPPDPPKGFSEWDRGRRSIGVDLKHPDGVEVVLRLAGARRRAARVVPARRRRAPRGRSRRRARPQPEARLRPPHRLGAGRPARAQRRPLAQLRVAHRRHRFRRRTRRRADPGAPGARRLRRRGTAPRVRRGVRAVRGATIGQGSGGRRRDDRRRRVDLLRVLRHGALGHAHRGHRHQPLRRRLALLLGVRDRRRQVRDAGADRAALLRAVADSSSASRATTCPSSTTRLAGRR